MFIRADFTKLRPGKPAIQASFQLNLKHGRINYLVGPPGSGKRTLFEILLGRLRPDQGSLTADGKIWFQGDAGLFVEILDRPVNAVLGGDILSRHQTVRAILSRALSHWPTRTRARRVAVLLDRIAMERSAECKVLELDLVQRWKLTLARALASRPGLLLVDEPFAFLDPGMSERFESDLRLLVREEGASVLISDAGNRPLGHSGDLLLRIEAGRIYPTAADQPTEAPELRISGPGPKA
jgi:ABC-type sulfate/molybdate transport systems ATPase subunit